ncbi:type II toxin-antitoxin system RelE family toxin [Stenomitos frigidus]|uniref:Cytotoxic translational repressor of toxin-antitoxin stability system n=1 Tax=Stenomitos frigidus ULC18 TaxID=2107698 RepID=A0A2T1DV14_9CYAN|nr:type II toxin-antitoxin system RelE/ParE family toxin [Stenomitos frigidus]PSB24356.1 cytotoxic translational repressor of toxin-antitoxin stability system [Stenomitos frigidus ULC18]
MKIKLSKAADKFLQKLDRSSQQAVIAKIGTLKACLETQKIYPPEELDIKKLKGTLSGFSRIRVGKIRVIFQIRRETNEIFIYDINYRGNIYN